ncbi:lysophospholipid acyltransferase family protein [bacterium]|nr:lysophospholipid acyltransferase family protein [bacterium]
MSKVRKKLKDWLILKLSSLLGPLVIRFFGLSCRFKVEGEDKIFQASEEGKPVILAFWHGRMLLPIYHFRNRGISSLVSYHIDGEAITRTVQRLGYVIRRGSPKLGGREGFFSMLRDLKNGKIVSVFPDGPKGPRHKLKDGVLQLARLSGAVVFPISYSAEKHWLAGSWDRFMILKPLSRALIIVGDPLTVPRKITDDEVEDYRIKIENALTEVESEVDYRMGVTT